MYEFSRVESIRIARNKTVVVGVIAVTAIVFVIIASSLMVVRHRTAGHDMTPQTNQTASTNAEEESIQFGPEDKAFERKAVFFYKGLCAVEGISAVILFAVAVSHARKGMRYMNERALKIAKNCFLFSTEMTLIFLAMFFTIVVM